MTARSGRRDAPADAPGSRRPALPLIFSITATGITVNTLITASLPEILAGVGASPGQAGYVIGAATLPGIVLAPVIGFLADRYGRREVLAPCLLLFAAAGGLAATSPSLGWLLAWRFLQGVGSAGLINLAVVLIGDHWDASSRAGMIGRNSAVLTTCLAVFPLVGGTLTDLGGWRAPFLLYPLALVTAVAVLANLPRSVTRDVHVGQQLRDLGPALRRPGVGRALGSAAITFALIFGLLLTVLPVHLEQAFGVTPTGRGLLLGLPALANTAVALNAGRLQRFSKRVLLTTAAALLALALGMAAAAPSLALLVAAIVCFGAGEGLMLPNLQDIAAGSSDASRGSIVALFVSASRVGQTVGPVAAGAGFAAFGAPAAFGGGAGLCLVALLPLALSGRRVEPLPPAGPAR